MSEPRQKPISIASKDRATLDLYKRRYEEKTGDKADWGAFLGAMVLLGLATAGVYHLAKTTNRSPQSMDVQCCQCRSNFILAVPRGSGGAIQTTCPRCGDELVVDLGSSR